MSAAGADDIHSRIRSEAEAVAANPMDFIQQPGTFPALSELLKGATSSIDGAIPVSFEYKGRRYWIRLRMMMASIAIYADPVAQEPMIHVLTDGPYIGHKPGH